VGRVQTTTILEKEDKFYCEWLDESLTLDEIHKDCPLVDIEFVPVKALRTNSYFRKVDMQTNRVATRIYKLINPNDCLAQDFSNKHRYGISPTGRLTKVPLEDLVLIVDEEDYIKAIRVQCAIEPESSKHKEGTHIGGECQFVGVNHKTGK